MDTMKFRSVLHMDHGKRSAHAPGSDQLVGANDDSHAASTSSAPNPANTEAQTRTEDVDMETEYAAPVTHETIKPVVHEIKHEQIHREIHEHEVFRKIQPIIDVEVLPPRHFVPGPDGRLVEVSERDLPGCTGENQNWHMEKGAQCSGLSEASGTSGQVERGAKTRAVRELESQLEKGTTHAGSAVGSDARAGAGAGVGKQVDGGSGAQSKTTMLKSQFGSQKKSEGPR